MAQKSKKSIEFPRCFMKYGRFKKCETCPFAWHCKSAKKQLDEILRNARASE